ncbi:MAG TPA: efflux RND transporter periplasmic adaptor subunit [Vicinamibacterales bacterium]
MRRFIKIAAVVLVLGGLLAWAFRPAAVPADFARAERGSLQITVQEEGRTRVRDRYVVSAPLPGRMQRIELEPGDAVVAGKTVLAQFLPVDPALIDARTRAELEARVRAAESALGGARSDRDRIHSDLTFAQSELKRSRELIDQKVIAPRELEAAERSAQSLERALQSAEFAVRTAEYQLQIARASLLRPSGGGSGAIPLRAPVNGVVLRRLQQSETVVATGTPLIEVGDVHDLEIVSDLLSSAAVKVQPGQRVFIEQWGGDKPLMGRVRRIEPSGFTKISALGVEEQRVNVIVDFDERPTLGDGYRVEVRIVVAERENVVKVPASSLFRVGTDWALYTVEEGRAHRKIVGVGQQNGLEAEIVKGLEAGEQVIVYPSDAVADGVRVTARS